MLLKVDMNIYHDMKEKMWELAESKTPDGFLVVGAAWALDVMNSPVGKMSKETEEKNESAR